MKIIIDCFGGDNSPDEILKGVWLALGTTDAEFALCGNEKIIKERMSALSLKESGRITFINAETKIEGDDEPVKAIRTKKDSSLVVALNALKDGNGDAFVSAGNTGAIFAGATFIVKRIDGVKRAALASIIPTLSGLMVLIDTGANVSLRPEYYPQMAIMGSLFSQTLLKKPSPRVGLINIGEEESKGTETVIEAYSLLKNTPGINFTGNLEVRNLLNSECDVAVCDGWTGNIALKSAEGAAKTITGELKAAFKKNIFTKLSALIMLSEMKALKKRFDYKEYGAAPIIGVNKPVIKAHGNSDAAAFEKAIKIALNYAELNVIDKIKNHINCNKD